MRSAAALIALVLAAPVRAETPAAPAALARIVIDGSINPAVASFVHDANGGVHSLKVRNYKGNGPSVVMMAVFDVRD